MCMCLKEVCYEKLDFDFTSQNSKLPLFHGLDFKVFPNDLLTCPE